MQPLHKHPFLHGTKEQRISCGDGREISVLSNKTLLTYLFSAFRTSTANQCQPSACQTKSRLPDKPEPAAEHYLSSIALMRASALVLRRSASVICLPPGTRITALQVPGLFMHVPCGIASKRAGRLISRAALPARRSWCRPSRPSDRS